ncbi:phosphotransferase [Micromonospora sp. NPDC004540]|uniref:phosphotransferase family protein n=1 Tax=Micromonospora sp. NPDC004540 TaxID=3154457 RepID=UPI0033ACB410
MLRRPRLALRAGRLASILPGEVVCHYDPGPNNTVLRDGQPVAFIDFDFAARGHPSKDVGYMAWGLVHLVTARPAKQAHQLRTLADARTEVSSPGLSGSLPSITALVAPGGSAQGPTIHVVRCRALSPRARHRGGVTPVSAGRPS